MVWNGLVTTFYISLLQTCVNIGLQVRLLVTGSGYTVKHDLRGAVISFLIVSIIAVKSGRFLWKNYDELKT